jgi:TonB-linked SusC/RagA family outer membrane protein
MKILCVLLTAASLHLPARGFSQGITVTLQNAALESFFKVIEQQSTFSFVYSKEAIEQSKPVTIEVKNENLEKVLKIVFDNQPLSYSFNEKFIIIKLLTQKKEGVSSFSNVRGRVVNENGEPVAGASVVIKGTMIGTSTDNNGDFILDVPSPDMVLLITSVNTEPFEIRINARTDLGQITIKTSVKVLDAVIINKGYYTTSRRLNTGSVSKITAEEISKQPVSNPLAAMQGRVSGLVITQANGQPGSGFSVMIRGRNSIQNGTSPFYVIDGVPFISDADRLTQKIQYNAASPFNTINPEDIESIEVLKDADATAIYGSRGANGVILITTKKAVAGTPKVDLIFYTGWGKPTKSFEQMATKEYLQMRREAFANDGATPTLFNAPDLKAWDTTRDNNWPNLLTGNTARSNNVQLRFSGGTNTIKFLLNSAFYKETTVYPGEANNTRKSVSLNTSYNSPKNNFSALINAGYGSDNSNLYQQDLVQFINTVPNAPTPYDANGNLNWSENGVDFENPLAEILRTYQAITDRLTSNMNLTYKLHHLKFRVNLGYNGITVEEKTAYPIKSQNPSFNPQGAADFATTNLKTWIIEPQAEYEVTVLKKGTMSVLAGASWQQNLRNIHSTSAYGYTNDYLLNSTTSASTITTTVLTGLHYRYQSIFSRLGYNHADQYLVNLTFRRDGSSRFGPDKRFGNFWSIGTGWIFTEQKLFKEKIKFLSYGKLKASYGTIGSDQIGDYQYLDTWSGTRFTYQGVAGLYPTRITNPDYSWERKMNLDLSLELGLFKNRLLVNATLFQSRSNNQIIRYTLPDQTGSNNILRNFPGEVENKGLELEISSTNISISVFEWKTSFNLTIPKNKLISFPGLSTSSYSKTYIVGQPLNIVMGLNYQGVDTQTGIYKFEDVNRDGIINTFDYMLLGTYNPRYYGGLQNIFRYRSFELQFLFQFVKQNGRDPIYGSTLRNGYMINQSPFVIDRWQRQGDLAPYQRYTQSSSSAAWTPGSQIASSDAALVDASFVRLKNLSLNYTLTGSWMKKIYLQSGRLFVEAQNLFTITDFKGTDPENQNRLTLPPLRMIATGISFTF